MKARLKDLTPDELRDFFCEMGEKPFRAAQLFRWMYAAGAADFDAMTDLPAALRRRLDERAALFTLETAAAKVSAADGTRKYVFATDDGNHIESVFMKYRYGNAVCLSTQAGCRMGCAFCASGLDGLRRNLTAGEMTDQILLAQRDVGERIGRVVLMGTGEPLDNFDAVKRFVEIVGAADGLNIGRRGVTISTCGLIPGIRRMAAELPQVGLAVSLHAPNDLLRRRLLPVSGALGLTALLSAVRDHIAVTGRRATFAYALIRGLNDDAACASELAERLKGMHCHVNLIPLNEVAETGFSGSRGRAAARFLQILETAGVRATMRRELGGDIAAACGQLRLAAGEATRGAGETQSGA